MREWMEHEEGFFVVEGRIVVVGVVGEGDIVEVVAS